MSDTTSLQPNEPVINATGVYSNLQIREAIERGHIVQFPSQPENINGSSIDVTLGYNFYRTDQATGQEGMYNPYDPDDVTRYFGEPLVAQSLKDNTYFRSKFNEKALNNVDIDHPVIVLRPGERILAHTHEFIGIKAPGTSSMQARSTTGRNGIAVCIDAGWGDPGYINRWTMEILNLNESEHVLLPVGMRIAQLVFFHTGEVSSEYSQLSGKYQLSNASDLETIVASWQPSQMLPKAYKDTIAQPMTVDGLAEGVL